MYSFQYIDLYLISEKSTWKNQVQRTGFLVYFELDFYCLCSLLKSISKSPVRLTWFFQLDFSKIKYRSTGGQLYLETIEIILVRKKNMQDINILSPNCVESTKNRTKHLAFNFFSVKLPFVTIFSFQKNYMM